VAETAKTVIAAADDADFCPVHSSINKFMGVLICHKFMGVLICILRVSPIATFHANPLVKQASAQNVAIPLFFCYIKNPINR
jgi:hypothetical protein